MIPFGMMRPASLLTLVLLAACSSTGDRSSLGTAPRSGDDDDDDAVKVASDAGPTLAPEAGADAGPISSATCKIGGLTLCFAFDGAVTDGSPNGIKPKIANITFASGKDGQAASFGPASQMTFEPNQAFDLPADAATLEAWVKRQSTGADAVVFDDDGRFSLTLSAVGKVICASSGGAVTSTSEVAVEDWTHVACVIDKGKIRVYVNGKKEGEGDGAIAKNPTLGAALGQNAPTGSPYYGLIDSFRLMFLARPEADIAADAAR